MIGLWGRCLRDEAEVLIRFSETPRLRSAKRADLTCLQVHLSVLSALKIPGAGRTDIRNAREKEDYQINPNPRDNYST